MSSIILRLLERFYPSSGYNAVMIGLDASGKTTLLYRMKLGEVVQVIPTIAINVETVRLKARGRSDRVLNLTCWDVGGCGRGHLTSLIVYYALHTDAIIWFVIKNLGRFSSLDREPRVIDSSDRERLEESIAEFTLITGRLATNPSVPPKDRPVLIIATKQDMPAAMSLDEIRLKVVRVTAGRSVFSVGVTLNQSLTDGPLPDAFGWLLMALESGAQAQPLGTSSEAVNPRASSALEERLPSWLARAEGDSSPAEFLRQFEMIHLPSLDHYTHIRIAYLLLSKFGRQKGKDMVFQGIERYIAQSSQTRGKTFHVTMTYFWIQIVHFGIRSTPPLLSDSSSDLGSNTLGQKESAELEDDFSRFLLLNPFVADGNLWAEYYSKGVMMNARAKTEMVLPDLKQLPNLVVRDAIATA